MHFYPPQICHPERSEGSAFVEIQEKQIPRANPALGMTGLEYFSKLFNLTRHSLSLKLDTTQASNDKLREV